MRHRVLGELNEQLGELVRQAILGLNRAPLVSGDTGAADGVQRGVDFA